MFSSDLLVIFTIEFSHASLGSLLTVYLRIGVWEPVARKNCFCTFDDFGETVHVETLLYTLKYKGKSYLFSNRGRIHPLSECLID